jgi:hypothetical protein
MHQKVILENRVPVIEEKLIEYIIDYIPDHVLRNQARWFWDKKERTKSGEKSQSRKGTEIMKTEKAS